MAGCYEPPRTGSLGTIEIQVGERANLETLKGAIESLVLRYGTIECGIGGYDFRIMTEREARKPGTPEEIAPGIKAVTPK